MDKKTKVVLAAIISASLAFSTGCSIKIPFLSKEEKKPKEEVKMTINNAVIGKAEDEGIKKIVIDYFKKIYKEPIENYKAVGQIPDNVNSLISKRTIDEGNNNAEVGIYLPRYVEMNGLTTTSYELFSDDGKDVVDTTFIGKSGERFCYFTKVNLKAKCLPEDVFNANYKTNTQTGIIEKSTSAVIDENKYDFIKLQVKYDVEVVKEGNDFKILTAKEASVRPGFKNRYLLFNNDSYFRLPYLNTTKKDDGKTYLNEADGKKYESEKVVIEAFFNNLKSIDLERMNLLRLKWITGVADYTDFVKNKIKITTNNGKEIMFIGNDYKSNFSLDSFPLQLNMVAIKNYENMVITPHPSYSEKIRKYIVTFNALAEINNGVIGNETKYSYDYFITLIKDGDAMKVDSMKLNGCDKVKEADTNQKGK